jgi:hypothetical protein
MVVDSVPVNRELTNITVTGTECFDALQTITVAGNDSTFTVPAGGATTLIAGLKILFYPGTTVHPGGYLYGYIAPSGPFCTIPTKIALSTGKKSQPVMPEKNFFRLYPNPTNGDFTVALKGYVPSERTSVEIYNTKGEKIFSAEMNNTLKQGFTLTGNPAGLYLVRVISGNLSGVERIIKQ